MPKNIRYKTNKSNRKTAVEYVEKFNHLPVPIALDFARQSFLHDREYGIVQLAYEKGANGKEIAEALKTHPTFISRNYPKGGKK